MPSGNETDQAHAADCDCDACAEERYWDRRISRAEDARDDDGRDDYR